MAKDRVKRKVTDIKARAKRQAGEWTGDQEMQAEGAADQIRGKAQGAMGNLKDAARDVKSQITRGAKTHKPKRAA